MVIALIIPAHNEEVTIRDVVLEFHRHRPDAQIWVIDNNSSDRTNALAREAIAEAGCGGGVLFESRQGKAFAMRKALIEVNADVFVMVDADLTYPASEINNLIQPVIDGAADMVIGDRLSKGVYDESTKRRFHKSGNLLVRFLINWLFSAKFVDIMSGYRAMNAKFVKLFPVLSSGFQLETEMNIHAADKQFVVKEIPIDYKARPEGSESKVNTIRDGIRVVRLIFFLFKNYRPMPLFFTIAAMFFVASLAVAFPVIREFVHTGLVWRIPSAILSTGLMVFSGIFVALGLMMDSIANYHRFAFEMRYMDYMGRR